ncbi:ion transporter, partial [Mycobacterium tuberculosis]|nr:ion transporter [Mycobacterium tuberculosis]
LWLRRHDTNLPLLILLFVLVAAIFSAVFFVIAINRPGEFDGITTRIDALYFTLTTMTTTGYGDITAVGQLARVLVSAVFVFDLVFL